MKVVIIKYCVPFTKCISEINTTQVDNSQEIVIVMSMHNLIEYSDNYAKTSGGFGQDYRVEPNTNLEDSESW